jgi:hypothetical protein
VTIRQHDKGITYARHLIELDRTVKRSQWPAVEPSNEERRTFIEREGIEEFGRWHLAIDTNHEEKDPTRYMLIFGDFRSVHRSAVAAAKLEAAQHGYDYVERAANYLIYWLS